MSMAIIAGGATAVAGLTSAGLSIANAVGNKGGAGGGQSFPTFGGNFNPISNVGYNPAQMGGDLAALYPFLQQAANQATANQTRQREKIMPGAANQLRLGSDVLQSYLQGVIPQDVVDRTNRIVAERTGGGFNPFTGGGSSQNAFARSIGQTSLDITNLGLSAAPTWQQLANSFVVSPVEFGSIALGLGQQRYAYDALNTDINQFNETGGYAAQTGAYNAARDQWGAQNLAGQQQFANNNALAQGIGGLGGAFASLASIMPNRSQSILANAPATYMGEMEGVPVSRPAAYRQNGRWNAAPALSLAGNPYRTGA